MAAIQLNIVKARLKYSANGYTLYIRARVPHSYWLEIVDILVDRAFIITPMTTQEYTVVKNSSLNCYNVTIQTYSEFTEEMNRFGVKRVKKKRLEQAES